MMNSIAAPYFALREKLHTLFVSNKHRGDSIRFSHKNLYILPSRLGLSFIFIAILNFLLATNYQNNLVLIVSYLMILLVILSLLQAYNNLKGLEVSFKGVQDCVAGAESSLTLALQHPNGKSHGLSIQWHKSVTSIATVGAQPMQVTLRHTHNKRGIYKRLRIKLTSHYPFALARVWSYLEPQESYFVYPKPVYQRDLALAQTSQVDAIEDDKGMQRGQSDFYSFTPFRTGDDFRRIAWRQYAKTNTLYAKEFTDPSSVEYVIDEKHFSGNIETRVSAMADCINQARKGQKAFTFILGNNHIDADNSTTHYQECMRLLAQYRSETVQ